jgi:hypothetical protein
MKACIKERLLAAINTVVPIEGYDDNDYLFGEKHSISPVDMVYILIQLGKEFNFDICDDYVDKLENATFADMEELLREFEGTKAI